MDRFFRLRFAPDEQRYYCQLADLQGRTLFSLPVPQSGNADVERLLHCAPEDFGTEAINFIDRACDWPGCSVREIVYASFLALVAVRSSRIGVEGSVEFLDFISETGDKLGLVASPV